MASSHDSPTTGAGAEADSCFDYNRTVLAFTEVQAGSRYKMEEGADGNLYLDRILAVPLPFVATYGYICDTLAADGDALDVVIHFPIPEPFPHGRRLAVYPVGVLRMEDCGVRDDKILAVVMPPGDEVGAASAVPDFVKSDLEYFFAHYKDADEGKHTKLLGWGKAKEAWHEINQSRAAYSARRV